MGCSPWGHKESDMTEVTQHAHTHARTGPYECDLIWKQGLCGCNQHEVVLDEGGS